MVTDVNHHVRDYLKRELEKEAYEVSCANSGMEAYKALCSTSALLDWLILDPELLSPYEQSIFKKLVEQNSSVQVIIHTYDDFMTQQIAGNNVHFVLKGASSIKSIKEKIGTCLTS
jgi:DNA-binding response OmpR family regulator